MFPGLYQNLRMPYRQPTAARVRALSWGLTALALCLALAWGPAPAVTFDPILLTSYARRQYGARTVRAAESWQVMQARAAALDEQGRLRMVNAFWNDALVAGEDLALWGQVDYWATPLESLAKGAGDAEDYVIGKYFSLLSLGVPPDRLRFVYARARVGGRSVAHMVLGYYPQPRSEPLVLDNLVNRVLPASARPDLMPVFSFDARKGIYAWWETVRGGAARLPAGFDVSRVARLFSAVME